MDQNVSPYLKLGQNISVSLPGSLTFNYLKTVSQTKAVL